MKYIAVTGPESSGKTTLARTLAEAFDTAWVPEYARTYLELKPGAYTLKDLEQIAIGQAAMVWATAKSRENAPCIFLDTWMLEIAIWAEYRFGTIPGIVAQLLTDYPPDLYLLCQPDLPWEDDPLRENPLDRDTLYQKYAAAVDQSGIPVINVQGSGKSRERDAIAGVRVFLEGAV